MNYASNQQVSLPDQIRSAANALQAPWRDYYLNWLYRVSYGEVQNLNEDLDAWMSGKNKCEREAFCRQACWLAGLLVDKNHSTTRNL
jgi:hypothetical protein